MASSETTYNCYMFHLDQHEINGDELRNIPEEGNYFFFRLNFLHVLRSRTLGRDIYSQTIEDQHTIPRREYLAQSLTLTRNMLMSKLALSSEEANYTAPIVASFVKEVTKEVTQNNTDSMIEAFIVNFHAVTPNNNDSQEEDQDDQIEHAMRDSANEFQTIPATQSSIDSLKVESSRGISTTENYCTICFEEIMLNMEGGRKKKMVRMPCSHLYHKDCIHRWLQTSHLCPLCRYAMPTSL